MRSFDPTFEPNEVVGVRRLEVITGVGGRRSWSREDKGRITAESFAADANVSAVARRYGLRPQQVYAWRRQARTGSLPLPAEEEIGFVPVIATGGAATTAGVVPSRAGGIEIELAGTVVRVAPGVDWRHLRDVLRAVKAAM
ncbi:MAG TPA: transposase [Stellaceae bacterium]|nr:transposase [Stellaceae bacterium]